MSSLDPLRFGSESPSRLPLTVGSVETDRLQCLQRLDAADGSAKFIWQCSDGNRVESVHVKIGSADTICVSSQAGCALQCGFCATGLDGIKRNLTPGEITAQIEGIVIDRNIQGAFQVSFMGMGEPLLNLEGVLASMAHIRSAFRDRVSFFLSTVGIVPMLEQLKIVAPDIDLQISLHAPNDELRSSLMPVNRKYPIALVLRAADDFAAATGRPFYINYIVFRGLNDHAEHAEQLANLAQRLFCWVKITDYNAVEGIPLAPAQEDRMQYFCAVLAKHGVRHYRFTSQGRDVGAACGHLRPR